MLTGNTDGVTTNVEFADTAIRKVGKFCYSNELCILRSTVNCIMGHAIGCSLCYSYTLA